MQDEEVQYDIKVVNAYKSFGDTNVINGLYMKIRSGSIYGFLGASGCGKSTLLQCILGKFSLDSGTIELKADNLKDIGYMPQNLSLENTLTIKEIFEYYGALYRMTKEQINRRINHLGTILQLPDLGQYIKHISGGQSRRVSLAISILHEPKIIMLDEPTVGMDSLLRENIWEEFSKMVKQSKKTFIITTHYIEEATKANCVGLMRNGVLIEEGPPQDILMKYETDSLESAFLILCCKQENVMTNKNSICDIQNNEIVHTPSISLRKPVKTIDFMRIIALVKKNTRIFSRDCLLLMLIIFFPIIQSFILCLGIGVNIKGLTISVKNDEVQLSDCLHFNNNGCILDEANNQTMSCVIMNYLSSVDYKLVEVNDRDTSETIMRDQNSLVFLYFPKEYTKNLKNYISDSYENYDFESSMHVNIDNYNLILKNQITDDVTKSVQHVIKESLQACSKNPRSVNVPINFDIIFGKEVKSFLNYEAALYVATTGFYLSSIFSVSLMLSEKMDGLLERSMFAGVTVIDLLISLFCINMVIYVIQMAITLFIVYIWFPNPPPTPENFFIYFIIVFLIGLIGFFFGILAAGLLPTQVGAVYGASSIFWTQFMLSGFEWPIEGQIYWMRPMSKLLPMSIAGNALNDITLKGWAWDHPSVMYSSSLLIAQLFLVVMVIYGLGKVKKDMWIMNK